LSSHKDLIIVLVAHFFLWPLLILCGACRGGKEQLPPISNTCSLWFLLKTDYLVKSSWFLNYLFKVYTCLVELFPRNGAGSHQSDASYMYTCDICVIGRHPHHSANSKSQTWVINAPG